MIANIKFIKKYRDSNHLKLNIGGTFVITKENCHEVDLANKIYGQLFDEFLSSNVLNQGGYNAENANFSLDPKGLAGQLPCPMLFNRLHITKEGYLTCCCVDFQNYLVVADLNKQTLEEAWVSDNFIKIRKKHIAGNVSGTICSNCIYCRNDQVSPLSEEYATQFNFTDVTIDN